MTKLEIPRKTGKWLRDDVPHTGWHCVEVNNNGGVCEMCEVTNVSYVHVMRHERWPLSLECGCVCAGFMAEDPATERLRELLYKWRAALLAARTPAEKLRRKHWRRTAVPPGYVLGWVFRVGRYFDHSSWTFHVLLNDADGWRYELYQPMHGIWRNKLLTSEPFVTDISAATAGIEHAEMLMANPQWVASTCEAEAEARASRRAAELASAIQYLLRIAGEFGRTVDVLPTTHEEYLRMLRDMRHEVGGVS